MTHTQIYFPFDNAEGFIAVVCCRERYLSDLKSLGWKETEEEVLAERHKVTKVVPHSDRAEQDDNLVVHAGLSKSQRKKLSLNK